MSVLSSLWNHDRFRDELSKVLSHLVVVVVEQRRQLLDRERRHRQRRTDLGRASAVGEAGHHSSGATPERTLKELK
jgi:hypothetical protein